MTFGFEELGTVNTRFNIKTHRTTGSTRPSKGFVFPRGLVFHGLAPSNRDKNRDLRCGTVTVTVSEKAQCTRRTASPHTRRQYAFYSKHSNDTGAQDRYEAMASRD
jgi:hypothetical protein